MWLCVDGVLGASQAPTTWWMEEPSAHARMYFFDIRLFENFERVGKHKREVARVNGGQVTSDNHKWEVATLYFENDSFDGDHFCDRLEMISLSCL